MCGTIKAVIIEYYNNLPIILFCIIYNTNLENILRWGPAQDKTISQYLVYSKNTDFVGVNPLLKKGTIKMCSQWYTIITFNRWGGWVSYDNIIIHYTYNILILFNISFISRHKYCHCINVSFQQLKKLLWWLLMLKCVFMIKNTLFYELIDKIVNCDYISISTKKTQSDYKYMYTITSVWITLLMFLFWLIIIYISYG